MITSIVSTICCISGIIGIFTGNITLIIVGAIADIIENLLGMLGGQQNNLITVFLALFIGAIVGSNNGNILLGMAQGLCWEGAIVGILSIPTMVAMIKNIKNDKDGK